MTAEQIMRLHINTLEINERRILEQIAWANENIYYELAEALDLALVHISQKKTFARHLLEEMKINKELSNHE
jgi:hypothetical protein